jgi:hypothetical protein
MRCGIVSAAALAGVALAISATSAQAEEWCGYAAKEKSLIECGYSTVADCESVVGKGGMCFVDPELAFNGRRGKLVIASKHHPAHG